jgi:hypothetical protein
LIDAGNKGLIKNPGEIQEAEMNEAGGSAKSPASDVNQAPNPNAIKDT